VGDPMSSGIREDGVQGFKVGMDVSKDRKSHGRNLPAFRNTKSFVRAHVQFFL
jgi:hypothetical protein